MGILKRLRDSGEAFIARRLGGEAVAFSAAIPGRRGPLWQLRVELQSEPQADGERLRLRVHTRLSLRRSPAQPHTFRERGGAVPVRVGRWLERRLEHPLVQAVAEPLLDRDVSTWVELQASSAALDEGSQALLPERLRELGIEPTKTGPVQTWAGAMPGARPGFALLTLARMEKSQLPPPLRRALGRRPFQMTAAVASVVEDA